MKTKKQRENRAIEAIVAGILRDFTNTEWSRVFQRMDKRGKISKLNSQATAQNLREWDEKPWAS